MSYLLTGSDDGFIRCYDFFASVNGKTYLTAPQRHHCGIGEGTMKAGVLKMWWENWAPSPSLDKNEPDGKILSPVRSMAMQSDALWSLSGTAVRRLIHRRRLSRSPSTLRMPIAYFSITRLSSVKSISVQCDMIRAKYITQFPRTPNLLCLASPYSQMNKASSARERMAKQRHVCHLALEITWDNMADDQVD